MPHFSTGTHRTFGPPFTLNILAALIIGIPSLIIVPFLTYLLGHFTTWMAFLAEAGRNLFTFTAYMILTAVLISGVVMFVRSRLRNR